MTKLSQNKTWNSFANNLALPMIEGYGYLEGLPELRLFLLSKKSLELPTAFSKIDFIRNYLGVKQRQNIALLEGEIEGNKIVDIAVSGQKEIYGTVPSSPLRIFQTEATRGYDRLFDSEVKLLENFAQKYQSTPEIKGALNLTSQWKLCASCEVVISQFQKVFPNVNLTMTTVY